MRIPVATLLLTLGSSAFGGELDTHGEANEVKREVGDFHWSFPTDGKAVSTPCLDRQGDVFIATADSADGSQTSTIYRVSSEGMERWFRTLPNAVTNSPLVTDTRVYVACYDTHFYCLDKEDGQTLWSVDTAGIVDAAPCIDERGNIYFGSRDRLLRAVDPDGEVLWVKPILGEISSSPILDVANDRLFVADTSNTIYSFTLSGDELWSYRPRQSVIEGVRLRFLSSPALDQHDRLYIGSGDFHLYCVNANNGRLIWKRQTEGIVDSSPVISFDGILYVANREGFLYAINTEADPEQHVLWKEPVGDVFYSSPTVDALGNVYMCGAPPKEPNEEPFTRLKYFNGTTGEVLWEVDLPGYTDASPTLDCEGNIYLGTAANMFHKIQAAGNVLADTGWPTYRSTADRFGRFEMSFSHWRQLHGISQGVKSELEDPDGDGRSNLEEYVLGSHPLIADEEPFSPEIQSLKSGDTSVMFRTAKGIRFRYGFEVSDDLEEWDAHPFELHPSAVSDEVDHWSLEVPLDDLSGAAKWMRMRWEK